MSSSRTRAARCSLLRRPGVARSPLSRRPTVARRQQWRRPGVARGPLSGQHRLVRATGAPGRCASRGAVFSESAIVVLILAVAMIAVTQLLITAFKQRGSIAIESVQDQAPCPASDERQLSTPYPDACK